MIEYLLIEIGGSLIWFVLGFLGLKFFQMLKLRHPIKKLWKISEISDLYICVATSTKSNTGVYTRPATGIGQVQSIGHVVESLGKAYNLKIKNITLSTSLHKKNIEKDLILMGGPKNNEFSSFLLEKINDLTIVTQTKECISWLRPEEKEDFFPIVKNRKVKSDYGIIIRMKNPFDTNKKTSITLFSGFHTYGTIAASKYFTEQYIKSLKFFKKSKENIFLIIQCDVIDGYPTDLKLVKKYEY